MNTKKIFKKIKKHNVIFFLMSISIFGYLSEYGFNVILTHYLNKVQYGDINIALRILTILSTLALLGTHASSKRFMSQYLHFDQKKKLRSYIHWNMRTIKTSFTICIMVAIVSYTVMHLLHIWHIKNIKTYHLAFYMLWLAPLASILNLLNSYISSAKHPIVSSFFINAISLSYGVFFIIIVLLFNIKPNTPLVLLGIITLGLLFLIILNLCFIQIKIPQLILHMFAAFSLRKKKNKGSSWSKASICLILSDMFYLLIFSISLILLKLFSPHAESAGLFAAVLTIIFALLIIPQDIYIPLRTEIAHFLLTNKKKMYLESQLRDLNRISCIITLIIAGSIFMFSKTLLHHLGVNYIQVAYVLHILIIGFIMGAIAEPAKTVLAYSGNESATLIISFVEISTIIILGSILTYYFNIVGTAIATTITITLRALLYQIQTYRLTRVRAMLL
jgi:O-antigen/teichoic acid export membrane protein